MARFSFTTYKNSAFATILSFLGSLYCYIAIIIGVPIFFNNGISKELIATVTGLVAAGILHMVVASKISSRIAFSSWEKELKKSGIEEKLSHTMDIDLAIQVYNANPCKYTLRYISKVNSYLGEQLSDIIKKNIAISKKK